MSEQTTPRTTNIEEETEINEHNVSAFLAKENTVYKANLTYLIYFYIQFRT